jgi:hypothetical protein
MESPLSRRRSFYFINNISNSMFRQRLNRRQRKDTNRPNRIERRSGEKSLERENMGKYQNDEVLVWQHLGYRDILTDPRLNIE